MLSFEEARAKVIEVVSARARTPETTVIDVGLEPALAVGRILAEDVLADRNYPPFDRAIRDGFAVKASEAAAPGAKLRIAGESRAGTAFTGQVKSGECVRIFTGAAMPKGANAVVMQEHTREEDGSVVIEKAPQAGQHFVAAGAEARIGEVVVPRGSRLSYAELAMAAEAGRAKIKVSERASVAILSTGDELVDVYETPNQFQIRNTNTISLAAQAALAGGKPVPLGCTPDDPAQMRKRFEELLGADILVISGGVSVGKYDFVEDVLREMGAEIFFDAISIRPGRPATFGWIKNKPIFALPGNPVSTMVTFELLVVPAIQIFNGRPPAALPLFRAKLAHTVEEKAGVAHFLPARVSWVDGVPTVEVQLWEGSGDIGAVVRANGYLVVRPERLRLEAGEWVDIFPRWGAL